MLRARRRPKYQSIRDSELMRNAIWIDSSGHQTKVRNLNKNHMINILRKIKNKGYDWIPDEARYLNWEVILNHELNVRELIKMKFLDKN